MFLTLPLISSSWTFLSLVVSVKLRLSDFRPDHLLCRAARLWSSSAANTEALLTTKEHSVFLNYARGRFSQDDFTFHRFSDQQDELQSKNITLLYITMYIFAMKYLFELEYQRLMEHLSFILRFQQHIVYDRWWNWVKLSKILWRREQDVNYFRSHWVVLHLYLWGFYFVTLFRLNFLFRSRHNAVLTLWLCSGKHHGLAWNTRSCRWDHGLRYLTSCDKQQEILRRYPALWYQSSGCNNTPLSTTVR